MTDALCSADYWTRVRGCNPPSVVLHDWDDDEPEGTVLHVDIAPPPPSPLPGVTVRSYSSVCMRVNSRMLEWVWWMME